MVKDNRRSSKNRQETDTVSAPVIPGEGVQSLIEPGNNGLINILIVDDEPKNLTVLETVLDDPRFHLVKAASADEALLALLAEGRKASHISFS